MKTLTKQKALAIPVLCAFAVAAAALWISGQSQAANTATLPSPVETNPAFVQDTCVDSALKLKLMIHGAGLIPNLSSGADQRGCGDNGLSVTDSESMRSACGTPDSLAAKPSPEQEKS